ncbi:Lar family restriction alleviation protein [Stutzerimonas nitrititolerans]|uniref:Lar family restriction alleviation protein n=1 Tax=Stutzerimonas nitrititolerans TaxID=2482751 RepID=UPI0028985CA8|nr:Lar family restriction alleviation protein [Stutzerimonas nitrititolerans]
MSEELKPCPFCGQQEAFVEQLDSDASVVICQGMVDEHSACLARGPVGVQEDEREDQPGKDAAIREWNRRAQPAEAEGVKTWRERIVAAHPKSEPGYWPDALLVEHMQPEIEELRAALSAVTAERDRLDELSESLGRQIVDAGKREIAYRDERDQLRAEVEALRKDADRKGMRIKELDLLFGRYLLAMKAALIDADYRGDEEGMRWIYNSLAGPGELPPENESDAQAFFDREIKAVNDGMAEVLAWHKAERDAAMAAKEA